MIELRQLRRDVLRHRLVERSVDLKRRPQLLLPGERRRQLGAKLLDLEGVGGERFRGGDRLARRARRLVGRRALELRAQPGPESALCGCL